MARKQNNTPKKVAKKRATVKKQAVVDQCDAGQAYGSKLGQPIDENSREFAYGVTRGADIARKELEKRDEKDPWQCYQRHRQTVIDINARLDDLEQEMRRLTTRLSHESAKMEGFRKMVIQLANTEPVGT